MTRACVVRAALLLAATSALGAAPAMLVGCSSSDGGEASTTDGAAPAPSPPAGPQDGGAPPGDAAAVDSGEGAASDGGPVTACPTTGSGAIQSPSASCLLVTPEQTGASAAGQNATVPSYALRPTGAASGTLVVFFNASESHPGNQIADPAQSFYTAATSRGHAVLALSYASAQIIGAQCATDACYGPTRETILHGVFQAGATPKLQTIRTDEGAIPRLAMLLRWLDANDPAHGWGAFLMPGSASLPAAQQIAWTKVVAAGHSQGGGHAAMVGKLFPVQRVLQLSSTCDEVSGTPASWTNAGVGNWETPPSAYWGLDTPSTFTAGKPSGGDTICAYHQQVWQSLGMSAAHASEAAATCGTTGETHGVSVSCKDNYPAWVAMMP